MTIGLILLALLAILIFFGATEKLFRSLGVSNWLAFILVLALVVGAVVPSITIAKVFTINLGGFVVPLIIMAVLMIIMRSGKEILRALLAVLSVSAVAVATRMLIEPNNGALILAASLIVGMVGGAVAFLVGQSRKAALSGALGGIILGDIITNFLYTFALGGYEFTLGTYGVFDSIIIASVFSILLYEAVTAIKRTAEKKPLGGKRKNAILAAEAGEDNEFETQKTNFESGDSDVDTELGTNSDIELLGASEPITPEEIDSFFDDYI